MTVWVHGEALDCVVEAVLEDGGAIIRRIVEKTRGRFIELSRIDRKHLSALEVRFAERFSQE